MISDELPQHLAVVRFVEDAFQHHVIAAVQRIARRQVDQSDIRSSVPAVLA
jgi:hypothetical protein